MEGWHEGRVGDMEKDQGELGQLARQVSIGTHASARAL